MPSSPHTGLLWALETLAWKPEWLTRVILVLARLAEEDPGGSLANRPLACLREIFLPWLPQTMASAAERAEVLEILSKRHPEVGFQTCLALLPAQGEFSNKTKKPRWRDWALNWSGKVTKRDYWEQVTSCEKLLIKNVGNRLNQWEQTVDKFEDFSLPSQEELLRLMRHLGVEEMSNSDRRKMTEMLRGKVQRHRSYREAHWTLPIDILDQLEEIQRLLEPKKLTHKHAWLFGNYPRLPEVSKRDWAEYYEKVSDLRRTALEEILAREGVQAVVELAKIVEQPHTVGFSLGETDLVEDETDFLPVMLGSPEKGLELFVSGFVRGHFHTGKWEWVSQLPLDTWPADQAGIFLSQLPFRSETWELVKKLGEEVSKCYWSRAGGPCKRDKKQVTRAASMLLKYDRPFAAIDVLAIALHQKVSVRISLIFEVLEAALDQQSLPQLRQGARDDIVALFERLQARSEVDSRRLALLEWGYLSFLDSYHRSPITLCEHLTRDPKLFVEILSLIYRPTNETEDSNQSPGVNLNETRARAQNAFKLLRAWTTVPGTDQQGNVNGQELLLWVNEARALSRESELLDQCDIYVGEVLAHAPKDDDGNWPCLAVRELLEEIQSGKVLRGFEVGIFNKRGVRVKLPTDGGDQQRVLARKYRDYARAFDIGWPTTASGLRGVAESLEREAQWEDDRVLKMF